MTGFLSPTDFAAGDDVIGQQVLLFDGDPAVARTGVRNDTVSLPLLAALQNVGNVVGGNCAQRRAAPPTPAPLVPSLCACSTHDTALAMLAPLSPLGRPERVRVGRRRLRHRLRRRWRFGRRQPRRVHHLRSSVSRP